MDTEQLLRKFILYAFIYYDVNPLNYDNLSEKPLPDGRFYTSLNPDWSNISVTGSPSEYTTEISIDFNWQDVLTNSQLVLVLFGFLANTGTLVTLFINGNVFSPVILILLRHQSASDATACLFSIISIVQPENPYLSGIYFIDMILCNFWLSNSMFYSCLFLSVWNLVLLAGERYLAVCHPFKHQELTPKRVHLIILGIYLLIAAIHWPAYYFSFKVSDGKCVFLVNEGASNFLLNSVNTMGVVVFFAFYVIPCTLFIVLYGLVILTFYVRQKQTHLGSSRVINRATSELTKTAIVVTVIFIITLGLNMWLLILIAFRAIPNVMFGPIYRIGLWLMCLNSAANPFVYSLFLPAYRKSVQNTFCLKCPTRSVK